MFRDAIPFILDHMIVEKTSVFKLVRFFNAENVKIGCNLGKFWHKSVNLSVSLLYLYFSSIIL